MDRFLLGLAIFLVIVFIIYFSKLYRANKYSKKLDQFSLTSRYDNMSLFSYINKLFWNFVKKCSVGLEDYEFIKKLSKRYDKYILMIERKYKSNIEYFAIKIMFIILLLCINMVLAIFYIVPNSLIIIILTILVGYFLPDVYWHFAYMKKLAVLKEDIYILCKNLDNSLKRDMSLIEALKEVKNEVNINLADELSKVIDDLMHGLSYIDAFNRFYKRCGLADIKFICDNLVLAHELGLKINVVFDNICSGLKNKYVKLNRYSELKNHLNNIVLITLFVPIVVCLVGLAINNEYFIKLFNGFGIIYLFIVALLYLLFLVFIRFVMEEPNE